MIWSREVPNNHPSASSRYTPAKTPTAISAALPVVAGESVVVGVAASDSRGTASLPRPTAVYPSGKAGGVAASVGSSSPCQERASPSPASPSPSSPSRAQVTVLAEPGHKRTDRRRPGWGRTAADQSRACENDWYWVWASARRCLLHNRCPAASKRTVHEGHGPPLRSGAGQPFHAVPRTREHRCPGLK